MPKSKQLKNSPPTLFTAGNVDVDLIRFEKNLLQFGFFGATDRKSVTSATRSFEMFVNRNNHRVKVTVEFIGSEKYGLPTTTDRDKFFAFLKIADEQRAREGKLTNPIRFSGYRLIQELGLERQGDIYADILEWGERLTVTAITSRNVVFLASKKVYNDDTLHVFTKFRRTAIITEAGKRQEVYEVFLADWLLDNLNQRWVVLEDVNAYKQLTRPIAKGIFSQLHLWYYANENNECFEKDYRELCTLLAVTQYRYQSRIKQTIGPALDELVSIKYLSNWDIRPMKTKAGYKIVMWPGSALQASVKKDGRGDKRQIVDRAGHESLEFSEFQTAALRALLAHGVTADTAKSLVLQHGHEKVLAMVEYAESLLMNGRSRIDNPAGLIVSFFKNNVTIPTSFITSQRRKEIEEFEKQKRDEGEREAKLQLEYMLWVDKVIEEEISSRFTPDALLYKVQEVTRELIKTEPLIRRVPPGPARESLALGLIRKEILEDLELPSLEDWSLGQRAQIDLFE